MTVNPKSMTAEERVKLLQHINDVAHEQLAGGDTIFLASQCKEDPRKFTIVADGIYDKQLEGVRVIFDDPADFKRIFPEFATQVPGTQPPGGNEHKDPYKIADVKTQPRNLPEQYNPRNVLDGNPNTRVAYKGTLYIMLDAGKLIDVSTIWIQWLDGDQRQAKFTLGAHTSDINNVALVPGYENVYSSGKSTDYESYNFSTNPDTLTRARYFLVKVDGNTKNDWSTVLNIKLTKARALQSMQVSHPQVPPTEPEEPGEEPEEPGQPPIVDDGSVPMPAENRKYNEATANKAKARKLSGKLPLMSTLDKNGLPYTDLAKLVAALGYPTLKRQFNMNHENYNPNENNNKGDENGKSLRLDYREYMPQFEYNVAMKPQTKVNDQIALKYGGIHNKDEDEWADCFIVRLDMSGAVCQTQLEPRHMAPDPFGYGENFNKINVNCGDTRNQFWVYRFTKINDIPNQRVICVLSVDKTGSGKDFDMVYETIVYDGQGGERVLKSPYAQWAYLVKKNLSKCAITVRMDAQGNHTLKKGENYKFARVTEILNN